MRKILLAILLIAGCSFECLHPGGGGEVPPPPPPPPVGEEISFAKNIKPVLDASCVKCHGVSGGVTLDSYESTLGAVEIGNPEESILCYVLEHQLMPPRGPLLNPETVKMVCDWIEGGAKP